MKTLSRKLLFGLIQVLLQKIFNFEVNRLLYSDANYTVYKLTRDIRNVADGYVDMYCSSLGKTIFFGLDVFFQKNDLRGYFNDYIDEESSRIFFLYLLQKSLMPYGKLTFLDVGSNYGTYSIPSVELSIPSILVEPNPFISTALHRTFKKFENIKIIKKAISSNAIEEHSACINIMPFLSGSSSLKNDISQNINTSRECFSLNVELISIDNLINEVSNDIDHIILKLDVEGIELDLFKGGLIHKLQARFKRFIVFVEYVPDVYSNETDLADYKAYLCSLPSILLSNNNYNYYHNYVETYNSFDAVLENGPLISNLYDIKIYKTNEAQNDLDGINYADVVMFSDLDTANNFMNNLS